MGMTADTVPEPSREIPVFARTEVLVVGGGSAGYCAALAAARHGAETLILERCAYLGGMTTGGLVTNRDYAGPDCPYKAVGGIPFEVWYRIEVAGGGLRPCPERVGSKDEKDRRYGQLFTTGPKDHVPDAMIFDPEVVKVVAETMLQEAGVTILLNCWFADAIVENGVVKGVIFECKEGRRAILADVVIDATGDGDVFARAGADFEVEFKEATVNFRVANVDWDAILEQLENDPEELERMWGEVRRRFNLRHGQWRLGNRRGISNVNTNTDEKTINVLDTRELTRTAIEMRAKNYRLLNFLRESQPGFENAFIVESAPMIGCRASRRLKGLYQLNEDDIFALKSFDDSIMLGACFYRQQSESLPADRPPYVVAEVPLRCLVPEGLDGLLAAGRCISCTFEALNWIRDIPFVMSSGQAAGIAAARCIEDSVHPRDVDVTKVQAALDALGAPFHMPR